MFIRYFMNCAYIDKKKKKHSVTEFVVYVALCSFSIYLEVEIYMAYYLLFRRICFRKYARYMIRFHIKRLFSPNLVPLVIFFQRGNASIHVCYKYTC